MNLIGTVLRLEFTEGAATPSLVIELVDDAGEGRIARCPVSDPEMVKVFRRTLSSGDLIDCQVAKADREIGPIEGFRIINKAAERPGYGRSLQFEHYGPDLVFSDADFEQPKEIEGSKAELLETGDTVFSLAWDADRPGGSGVNTVTRVGNVYFVDCGAGWMGPFRKLMDVLVWAEMDKFNTTTESISCSEMNAAALATLLAPWDDVPIGFQIWLNDEGWTLNSQRRLERKSGEQLDT